MNTGWLGIWVISPSGATCLLLSDCYFSELALLIKIQLISNVSEWNKLLVEVTAVFILLLIFMQTSSAGELTSY